MQRRKTPPLVLLMVLICFPQLSETVYTPSLPDLAESLHVSNALSQWTLSIYFIGFAMGVAFWGNCSDYIGRRRAILMGLLVYFSACLGCFSAESISVLLLFRLLQAFGISSCSVVVQSILREVYEGVERNRAFSLINISMAFSPAMGPLIGGYLAGWLGWKSNFLVLAVAIIFVFCVCLLLLKETNQAPEKKYSFKNIRQQLLQILSNPRILIFAILVALFNGIMFSYYSQAPFLFINVLGIKPSQYGVLGIGIAIGIVIGSLLSNRFSKRYPPEKLVEAGGWGALATMIILNINTILLVNVGMPVYFSIALISSPVFLYFISFSIAMPSLLGSALQSIKSHVGSSSSIFGFIYYIFTALFNFFMGYLDNGTLLPMPIYFCSLSFLIVLLCALNRKFVFKTST